MSQFTHWLAPSSNWTRDKEKKKGKYGMEKKNQKKKRDYIHKAEPVASSSSSSEGGAKQYRAYSTHVSCATGQVPSFMLTCEQYSSVLT